MRSWTWMVVAVAVVFGGRLSGAADAPRPNIVLILADDMGPGDLGCYGQKWIKTPNIDALAKGGMKFATCYAPSPVCAPTRCSLLTGVNQGHAEIRDNRPLGGGQEGNFPITEKVTTIAQVLKQGGYTTACVGKWGLGAIGSTGDPNRKGFDFFFGHISQSVAHNHYSTHLYRNGEKFDLAGNVARNVVGKQYAPDLMADEAVEWMKEQKGPFFLYFATPLPHISLQAPADAVARYEGKLGEDKPFEPKGAVTDFSYVRSDAPHATYAAMVSKVDEYTGRIMAALKEMGADDNTLVVFTSDNGPTYKIGGADSDFFDSTMGLRGRKEQVYEGGIREPMIVRWPGKVKEGSESTFVTALYDLPATFCEVAGVTWPARTDGVSIVPTITGTGEQKGHDYLYWEFGPKGGQKAVRRGDWKAVWVGLKTDPKVKGVLFDLAKDPQEKKDVSAEHPDVMKDLTKIRDEAHEDSPVKAWNF